jgi:signal transduction histidine kinase
MNRLARVSAGSIHVQGQSRLERYHRLSHELLEYSNRGLLRKDFLPMVAEKLLEFSGADGVELWVREGTDKHFRCSVSGASRMPYGFILVPCPLGEEAAELESDVAAGGLERLCCGVLRGRYDPAQDGFTPAGSFFWGDASEPFTLRLSEGGGRNGETLELPESCRSVALIPILIESEAIGLLLLSSGRPDFHSPDVIAFYEDVAEVLGVAFVHQYAQAELRERVKELTCLYQIARIVGTPRAKPEDVVQRIVDLLPGAWLYPEITQARILVDGSAYETDGFRDTPFKLTSPIVVGGEAVGVVEVVLLERRITMDEGPFLAEERSLIDSVAREVANYLERTRAEEERALLREQLRHADRLATIGQLAAGVAHELNEPLGNILGYAQLAKKVPDVGEQVAQDLGRIEAASLHARDIIKKLMVFARQLPPRRASVDLNQIVSEGLSFFEGRCEKAGVELVRETPPELPIINGDPGQLNQVLVNLVVNALQAMPDGGTLKVSTGAGAREVMLEVEDTGAGMSEEVRKRIFLPFFTTKDVNEGTGLGLAVVHGIVSAHGGTIDVETQEGAGSRFTVRLPVEEPEHA